MAPDLHTYLAAQGWTPGRDIAERAEELVDVRVKDAVRQGTPLSPSSAAVRVIRAYGLLRFPHPRSSEVWAMKPTSGYEGDAAFIAELATGLTMSGARSTSVATRTPNCIGRTPHVLPQR
ncbi:SUKH-3 domain-containing protein [Streptomyces djakartensis]|uniref:SUKH-3 domain-containing protein n=1 Tax=Streptomyces djakartensis TaxID=68193 RepID=UPI0034DE0DAF